MKFLIDPRLLLSLRRALLLTALSALSCSDLRVERIESQRAIRSRTFKLESGSSITIVDAPFSRAFHRLGVSNGQDTIDGRAIYGTDGSWPSRRVRAAYVSFNDGERVELYVSGMFDPETPGIDWTPVSMKHDDWSETYIVKGHFGSAAGSYDVEWVIRDGQSVRTSVREECNVWAEPQLPNDAQLRSDIPSEFSDCSLVRTDPWGYDSAGLDMILQLNCPGTSARRVVLRYKRIGSRSDGHWELAPRSLPLRSPSPTVPQ